MMHRVEKKYLQQVFDMDIAMNGDLDAEVSGGNSSATYPGGYNRWVHLGIDPNDLLGTRSLFSTTAGSAGYNQSAFALVIPQGVGVQERVGRDISVIRDDFFFRLSFPLALPQIDAEQAATSATVTRLVPYWSDVSAGRAADLLAGLRVVNANIGQRPVRVRLVGIFQRVLDRPGEFGFEVHELFNSPNEITSRFNKHDARGYHIVYDKTKTFYPQPGYTGTVSLPPSPSPARASAQKFDVSFSCSLKPYLRRYEGVNEPDNAGGAEVTLDVTNPVSGISMGAISWYMFVEDQFCSKETTSALASTSGAGWYDYTPNFMKLELNRKTLWTDP